MLQYTILAHLLEQCLIMLFRAVNVAPHHWQTIPLYIISFHFISPFPSNYDQSSPTVSNRVQQIYYLGDVGENIQFRKEQRC